MEEKKRKRKYRLSDFKQHNYTFFFVFVCGTQLCHVIDDIIFKYTAKEIF